MTTLGSPPSGGLPFGVLIGLLGPLEVATAGGRRVPVLGAKERCLLALLAVEANTVVPENRLAEALWGQNPPRTARRTLQGLVSRVRAVLAAGAADSDSGGEPASIEARGGGWILRVGPAVLDVAHAEAYAAAGRLAVADGDATGAAEAFGAALRLWRGEPLGEFRGAAWADPAAARLDELRRVLIEERLAAQLASGRHGAVVGELEVACREAPLRESLWELRMLALYRTGRQAEALRAFQELRRNLVEQLGIEPNPSVARLERAILAQDPALEWPPPVQADGEAPAAVPAAAGEDPVWRQDGPRPRPAAMAEWRQSTFVGREAELAELDTAWHRARRGARQAVLVAGEPGIGKTALVARVAEAAWSAGAMILFGRSDEDSVVAFQPWVEMLTHYVEVTPPAELRRHLGTHARDLALLVPELTRQLPELAGVAGTGAETERYRILDAVGAALAAMAACVPVVVVLDDLHWADRPTLQVLQHVIRRTAELPILLLGTYRDTDLVRTHPMAAVLADLRRADLVRRLSLRGLQVADVVELLTGGTAGEQDDEALARALWEETEGNPLFLRESLRHLAETGAIRADRAGRWRAQRRITQLGIPEGVREVIGRRLTRLSETANTALRTGSVQGREIRLDVLAAVTELDEDTLLDALEEATAAGVVTEAPGRPGRWSFTHALVRQALYGELTVTRRVRLHQRTGAALEALDGDGDGPHLAELAYHFTQAAVGGEAERAVRYCRRAAEYALKSAAFEEAARHYALALEVAEDAELDTGVRADLLLAQGDAQWRSGDVRLARRTFERVVPLVTDHDPERLARTAIGYAGAYARILWADIGIVEERAVELLELALTRLDDADSPLRALALAALAQALYFDAAASERRPVVSGEAVAMARRLGDPAVLGRVLCSRNLAVWAPGFSAEQAANSTEARAIGHSLGDRELEASACLHGFIGLFGTGEVEGSLAWLDDFGRLAAELKAPLGLSLHEILGGNRIIYEGRFAEGERRLLNAFRRSQEAKDPDAFMMYVVGMGVLRLLQGRVGEMRGSLLETRRMIPHLAPSVDCITALVYAECGADEEARRILADLDPADPARFPPNLLTLFSLPGLAWAAFLVGDAHAAGRVYDVLLPWRDHLASMGPIGFGSVELSLALCAATGRRPEAEEHFAVALAHHRRHGWTPWVAETLYRHAFALARTGDQADRPQIAELLDEVIRIAEPIGMDNRVSAARGMLSRLAGGAVLIPDPPRRVVTRRDRARATLTTAGRSAVAAWTRGRSDDELIRIFSAGPVQWTLMSAAALAFQPAMAGGFEGDIVYELRLPDDHGEPDASDWWTIEVRGRKATARRGRSPDPAVVIHADLAWFVRLSSGEVHAASAMMEGLITVDGDVMLAARFPDMFGAVPPIDGLLAPRLPAETGVSP